MLGAIACAFLPGPWARNAAQREQYEIAGYLMIVGVVLWGITWGIHRVPGGGHSWRASRLGSAASITRSIEVTSTGFGGASPSRDPGHAHHDEVDPRPRSQAAAAREALPARSRGKDVIRIGWGARGQR